MTVSETPKAPAAWGPASPNLTEYPSGTLPRDGTPRARRVSWAAGMLRRYWREEPVLCSCHGAVTVKSPPRSGEAPGSSGQHRARGTGRAGQVLKSSWCLARVLGGTTSAPQPSKISLPPLHVPPSLGQVLESCLLSLLRGQKAPDEGHSGQRTCPGAPRGRL